MKTCSHGYSIILVPLMLDGRRPSNNEPDSQASTYIVI